MTTRMIKPRKGISPILATLLLVVIAVAAIVVTYAWIMTYLGNAGQQAGVMLYRANVSFYINNVTDERKIDIDIGNSGTSDTRIIQAYVGMSKATLQNQTIAPVNLAAGSIQRITIAYVWNAGTPYYFRVISSTGQTLEIGPETAPSNP